MKSRLIIACSTLLLLMINVSLASQIELSLTLEGLANETVQPGRHNLSVFVSNRADEPLGQSVADISLSRLHEGELRTLELDIPEVEADGEFISKVAVDMDGPGLYTASCTLGRDGKVAEAEIDIPVSLVQDRWQTWRSGKEMPNKSHRFLAFYYPWYGNPEYGERWFHWEPDNEYASTHVPLIGFYDSRSEEVMRYHIRLAQSVGFDGFISSWWGPGAYTDRAFEEMLPVARDMGFYLTVYFEIAHDIEHLEEQLRYLLTRYGDHPAFMKVDGRPVIFIYGRVIGEFEIEDFSQVFARLESEGLPAFYMADRLDEDYLDVFDGLHTYSPLRAMGDYPEVNAQCQEANKTFAATLAPGYDDTIIRVPGLVVDRENGTYYLDSWETVMLTQPDWVLVTSWNEWHEGSEIEPSLEHGDLYLNLTERYYTLFENGRLTPRLERRIEEMEEMFSAAGDLVQRAKDAGMDTRIIQRDYDIARKAWQRFDYEVTRMYLQRILDREEEIPEIGGLGLVTFLVSLMPLCDYICKRDRSSMSRP